MPLIGITCNERNGENTLSQAYFRAVIKGGATPLLLPVCGAKYHWEKMLATVDGLLLSGGGDPDARHFGEEAHPLQGEVQPGRDRMELFLAKRALKTGIPLLGICRGAQIMAVASGGTLHQDIAAVAALQHDQQAPRTYPIHSVQVRQDTLLSRIVQKAKLRVNSIHHQAIKDPGYLEISAKAADGIIEAVEWAKHPFALGVQWHPEWLKKHHHAHALFAALRHAASEYRSRH